jgi:hypothetical protein
MAEGGNMVYLGNKIDYIKGSASDMNHPSSEFTTKIKTQIKKRRSIQLCSKGLS